MSLILHIVVYLFIGGFLVCTNCYSLSGPRFLASAILDLFDQTLAKVSGHRSFASILRVKTIARRCSLIGWQNRHFPATFQPTPNNRKCWMSSVVSCLSSIGAKHCVAFFRRLAASVAVVVMLLRPHVMYGTVLLGRKSDFRILFFCQIPHNYLC